MKNKVVIVNPDTGARIYITDNPFSFACAPGEDLLINPSTKMVDNLPPEMWKCVDGRLVPITEEHEVARRVLKSQTVPKIAKALQSQDHDLGAALEQIAKIKFIEPALDDLYSVIDKTDIHSAGRIAELYAELKHQRQLLVGIIIILLGEFLWLIFLD